MRLRRDYAANAQACRARDALLRQVLDARGPLGFGPDVWRPFSFFDSDGACVATLDAAILPCVICDTPTRAGVIRAVATHPAFRGRGLFRALMEAASAWIEAGGAGLTLLYTAESGIYARFGFRDVPQHSFVGDAPKATGTEAAHRLRCDQDGRLIARILAARAPVSSGFALDIDADQYLRNLAGDPSLGLLHLERLDALLVYEHDGADLVVVDVVASAMPTLAEILGALPDVPRRVRTMFAPDRLAWAATPEPEDTGLMARGTGRLPATPFMLPPTVEF